MCSGRAPALALLWRLGCLSATVLVGLARAVAAIDADTIVQKADEVRNPAPSYVMDVEITVERPGEPPTTARYVVSTKNRVKSLIKFTSPATEKGKAMLMVNHDMWFYTPTVSRPIRISPLQRLIGQVSNADVARTNYSGGYVATLVGSSRLDGRDCHVLDLQAKDDKVSYHRIRYWVEKETYRPVKAEFYALSDLLLKTAYFRDLGMVHGMLRPRELLIRDPTKRGHFSLIRYSNSRIVTLSDGLFRREALRSLR